MDFAWDRPLTSREILASAFALARQNGGPFIRLSLGPLLVAAAFDFASRAMPADSLAIVPVFLICVALYGIGESRASYAAWELLNNRPVDHAQVIAQIRRYAVPIVLTYALKSTLVLIGLLLLVVPGVLLLISWFAIPLANVVEGRGVRASLRRSRGLAKGNRRQIFATLAVIDLALTLVVTALTIAVADPTSGQGPIWLSILLWFVALVYLPFHGTLSAVLYANARMRNEGYAP